jgi:hypothetical protein
LRALVQEVYVIQDRGFAELTSKVLDREAAMLRLCHLVLFLPLMVFSSAPSLGDESPAMTLLKEKGLARSGSVFVIEAERPVLEMSSKIRGVVAEYLATAERKNESELRAQDYAQLEEHRVELQQRLDQLNQQINEQGFQQAGARGGGSGQGTYLSQLISQRNMIQTTLTQVAAAQKPVKALPETDQKTVEAENKKSVEAAKAFLTEFRASVDAVTKRYDELKSDASVKSALQALEKAKVGSFKLGPSPKYKIAVKSLDTAERLILAKKTSTQSRKKAKSKR